MLVLICLYCPKKDTKKKQARCLRNGSKNESLYSWIGKKCSFFIVIITNNSRSMNKFIISVELLSVLCFSLPLFLETWSLNHLPIYLSLCLQACMHTSIHIYTSMVVFHIHECKQDLSPDIIDTCLS